MDQRGIFLSSGVNLQFVAWVTKFRATSKVRPGKNKVVSIYFERCKKRTGKP